MYHFTIICNYSISHFGQMRKLVKSTLLQMLKIFDTSHDGIYCSWHKKNQHDIKETESVKREINVTMGKSVIG